MVPKLLWEADSQGGQLPPAMLYRIKTRRAQERLLGKEDGAGEMRERNKASDRWGKHSRRVGQAECKILGTPLK